MRLIIDIIEALNTSEQSKQKHKVSDKKPRNVHRGIDAPYQPEGGSM